MEELEENEIQTWRDALQDKTKEFVCISADDSMLAAVRMLIHNRIHRLPVVDRRTGNVLYILTHKRLLKFLHLYVRFHVNFFLFLADICYSAQIS
jgi:5'-AMP-activated protein kinase, regulatory gamma subunit